MVRPRISCEPLWRLMFTRSVWEHLPRLWPSLPVHSAVPPSRPCDPHPPACRRRCTGVSMAPLPAEEVRLWSLPPGATESGPSPPLVPPSCADARAASWLCLLRPLPHVTFFPVTVCSVLRLPRPSSDATSPLLTPPRGSGSLCSSEPAVSAPCPCSLSSWLVLCPQTRPCELHLPRDKSGPQMLSINKADKQNE